MEVVTPFAVSNSENVSENILAASQLSGKATLLPLKETLQTKEQEVELVEEEEIEESEDESEEEEEEEEDENADALPEGCLAPEHEALEASMYAAELGISEGQEALEFVGQTSWDRYDKVVDSYWKIVETEVRNTQYEQVAQEALQMNKKVDEVLLKLAREILPMSPAASAVAACRDALYAFIEKAIHKAYLFTENRGDFTISTEDLREAFRLMNRTLPAQTPQNVFGDMTDYKSEDDEDFVPDEEEMEMDQEDPLEWDSDVELEEAEEESEEVEGEEEVEEDEEDTRFVFSHELMNDIVNHYIDIITPSDDPEEVEGEEPVEEKEPVVEEVDVEADGIEFLQQMAQEFVQNIFMNANKVCSQYSSSSSSSASSSTIVASPSPSAEGVHSLKKALTNRDIKFVMDFCPELHF